MLLNVENLKTHYKIDGGIVRAIDGISFQLQRGENLGLVGESGCGKTTAARSINRILPSNGNIVDGKIIYKGQDLVPLSPQKLNKVRWQEISMVTQSAMNALDPVYKIRDQMAEAMLAHESISNREAWQRSAELFKMVGLEPKRLNDYPHQLSGGQKQRVVIAMALALNPGLIIADEPTTALDVVVQDGILNQFVRLQQQIESSLILVTHDISVVAEICQRVAVMYAGKIVEQGKTREIFKNPHHPYTMGLLNAFPTLEAARGHLISIPGSPPDLSKQYQGCLFQPRCPFATEKCAAEEPQEITVANGNQVLCHYTEQAEEFGKRAKEQGTWLDRASQVKAGAKAKDKKVLEVKNLKKHFPLKTSLLNTLRGKHRILKAVDGVDFHVAEQEIIGLAGESGSGKSTIGELLARLQNITDGNLLYLGDPTRHLSARELKKFRRNFQVIFQDPYETLNPRFTVLNTIMEPLKIHKIGNNYQQRLQLAKEALTKAELLPPENFFGRFPHQLSGGQRQRVALARAIVLNPSFIIADEPVSMLDVSIRAGILNLLKNLRSELGASIIYISHDLATIRYICDRTIILYLGRIAEIGQTEQVIENPQHPYTKLLLAAVPIPDPDAGRKRVDPRGDVPDPINIPNGCRFHPRCKEAIVSCGFEGRDLLGFIEGILLTDQLDETKKKALLNYDKAEIKGLNLTITLQNANDAQKYDESLMQALKALRPVLMEAINAKNFNGQKVTYNFIKQEEPKGVATAEGHIAFCKLLE